VGTPLAQSSAGAALMRTKVKWDGHGNRTYIDGEE
jgi:hypothetical protein